MKTRFLSEYTHTDGSRWVGPDYYADSFEEAQALAMEYPIQPIRIIGEHVETVQAVDDVQVCTRRPSREVVH